MDTGASVGVPVSIDGNRVTVLFEDYRELAGRYDQLVSIEGRDARAWRDRGFDPASVAARRAAIQARGRQQ